MKISLFIFLLIVLSFLFGNKGFCKEIFRININIHHYTKFDLVDSLYLIKCDYGYFLKSTVRDTKKKEFITDCFEMIGYENVRINQSSDTVSLNFSSSSFVASIKIFINYNNSKGNWTIIGGEIYNPIRMDFDSKIEVCSTSLNIPLESIGKEMDEVQNIIVDNKNNCTYSYDINRTFQEIYQYYKAKNDLKERRSGIERIEAYLKKYPLSGSNISQYNDIAFFMEQDSIFLESIFLIEKIINFNPNRTVAYINLGDSYWGLNETVKAKEAYSKYIELMKKSGKENKIPKRVCERVK